MALRAYKAAIDEADAKLGLLPRIGLARTYNASSQPALAAAVLAECITALETVPEDTVQFVLIEYCKAVRDLGRLDDARAINDHAVSLFPKRTEIARIGEQLIGDALSSR